MKSPARQGTLITTVAYKCDDCGDVSHSQESLSLHRSVCHSSGKSHDVSDSELIEESVDIIGKTEQIADACNCPKCGEHFLLLRQHIFNCVLCEFQDEDQERFFIHLKEHYEPNSVLNVDPGSVIIEQVIDDTNDLDKHHDPDNRQDPDALLDPDDLGEPDDRDDPEYVPGNDKDDYDDDDDDGGDLDWEEPKSKKRKLGASGEPPPKIGCVKNELGSFKSTDKKSDDAKTSKSKIGILWHQEKGAPKKMSFVKTPVSPSKAEAVSSQKLALQGSAQKRSSVEKKFQSPSKTVTVKKEPRSSEEWDQPEVSNSGISTKWVRLQDIKYLGTPETASVQRSPWNGSSYNGPSPRYRQSPKCESGSKYPGLRIAQSSQKGSSPTKGGETLQNSLGSSTTKVTGATEKPSTAAKEPKKKAPKKKKEKEPKPPRERKIPVCGVCKRVFSSGQALKTHLHIHTGEKNFSCEHCGKAFTQWSTCQQHIMSIHSGVKKFTCEYCGACFARSSALILHRRIHTGEMLHHCNICGKGFRAKSYFDRHRTLHTGEKRYKCEFCHKTFRTSTDMKRHRNSVHFGLGNVSLTQAKELLQSKMDGFIRTPQKPSNTVVQRFVNDNSSSCSDESDEVIRATTVIAGTHFEL